VGQDVAALEIAGAEVLVAHPDPITLAGSEVGRFAVMVNANDIATSGANPRWFLATVLLPVGTTASEAVCLMRDISEACHSLGVDLVGGHTEVTDAVTRPTVAGTMLGTIARADLREKRAMRTGDRIVLTARVAVEGTALLAMELGERLKELGMTDDEVAACHGFAERLSVLPAARVARGFAGVRAMHDVTEGGLATGLREFAEAGGCGVRVDVHRVPVYPETRRVCELLGADPLGLIGSGSMLVACSPDETASLVGALEAAGIEATDFGEVVEGSGVTATDGEWPVFEVDEAARLLARPEGSLGPRARPAAPTD
jgi:hydrogenase maturation factor